MRTVVRAVVLIAAASLTFAAAPPDLVNYQGVLRNAADKPQTGTFDMVFRFFDAASGGNEILVDSHTGGGGNAVTVTGGLFTAQLGGGTVTDGSGAGTYTALSQVFADNTAVWLSITVGAETLSPRVRVQSAAYALNASNLGGKPAGGYVDTSGSTQTKSGHLVASAGLEGNNGAGVGVQGVGSTSGGTFANQAITAVAHAGYTVGGETYGVHGVAATAGGWFQDFGNTGYAYLGQLALGVRAHGTGTGGWFTDQNGDYSRLATAGFGSYSVGTGSGGYFADLGGTSSTFVATTNQGIVAFGHDTGGHFSNNSGDVADIATGAGYGIATIGSYTGGLFHNSSGSGFSYVGNGDFGIYSGGNTTGGFFFDADNTGQAFTGYGNLGVDGSGAQAGGHFSKPGVSAQSFLAASNGFYDNGVYGISNGINETPGYFVDQRTGTYSYVGINGYKITGVGGVSFVQNHPRDPDKVIVYTAPEGDEVAVYTRGSARLDHGEAHVKLGETFAMVANPETGLTAHLTPRGSAVPLAVDSLSTSELIVRGPADGPQELSFDYVVYGLRIGFEDRPVVEQKHEEAFIPSPINDDALYADRPELRSFNARERFARMETEAGRARAALPAGRGAEALKAAIHVYDRDVDLPKMLADRPGDAAAQPRDPRRPEPIPMREAASALAARSVRDVLPAPGPIAAATPPNSIPVAVAESVEPGQVIANDATRPGELRLSTTAADPGVVGIVAGDEGTSYTETAPIAIAGSIVLCDVDAAYGAIAANDLLVASPTLGHAMRAGDAPKQGTVVAKALQPFQAGRGQIRVLVMSR